MISEGILGLNIHELKRFQIIQQAIDKQVTQKMAASILGMSCRQIKRLVRAVRQSGAQGVVHKAKGKASNVKIPDEIKNTVLSLYRDKYHDFGPTFACEKLLELDGIDISKETLRKWLSEGQQNKRKIKNKKVHRKWRERKGCLGAMVQIDGSHHDWLEGRGPELVLMAYIDDATSTVFGRFYDYEGTLPAMDSFRRYMRKYGLPQSVYLDRHSTYKSTRKLTPEEELEGIRKPLSQFERALGELGVEVIHAYSPQAKGRVERLFGTLQDRLIKEMRLKGLKTKEEANKFLRTYIPLFNRKYGVVAADLTDVHRKSSADLDINSILCIQTERSVKKDSTVTLDGKLYLIEDSCAAKKILFENHLDGSLHIVSNGMHLKYKEITERPKKEQKKIVRRKKPTPPSKDHPWKKKVDRSNIPKRRFNPY